LPKPEDGNEGEIDEGARCAPSSQYFNCLRQYVNGGAG
jgi:hypothetical protein